MLRVFALVLALAPFSASAQTVRDAIEPPLNTPSVASVGETIYEKSHLAVIPAFIVESSFSGKNVFARVTINAGDKFIQIPSKARLKACRSVSVEAFLKKEYNACLYDDNGDGMFDRFGGNEVQGGKHLPQPIVYKPSEFVSPMSDSVKQTVIFLGSTKDSLRMSYREFINDMARPAFTEEYTFPLTDAFPQPVSFKGVKLSVSGIDGEGLHYTVISVPANAN
jgi:hypothetical protein